MTDGAIALVERWCDDRFVLETLQALARTPADVPLGRNEIEPTDPRLAHYVHDVVRPMVERLGPRTLAVDELNNLIAGFGADVASPSVLVMAYTTAQHGNYTDEALEGRVMSGAPYGVDGDCVFGKGTSQNKGALAAALGALKILADGAAPLRGRVVLVVNAESQSSHRCSMRIFDGHGVRADLGWLAIGSPRIVLGHRGRVDIQLTVRGAPGHSSEPHRGRNAIWGLAEALTRIRELKQRLTRQHPDLGGEQLEPYKLVTAPIAPHTMPGEAHLTLDRRLLPDTDADDAVEEVRRALGEIPPYELVVRKGAHHLPYRVPADHPVVRALADAHRAVRGAPPEAGYAPFAFDAGYANARGIPTVMFGPSAPVRRTEGADVLATEFVPVSAVRDFTRIYALALLSLLG
jgi:acetylornithine deacetylase/succinyl-diaminopimelate desuccinylase-like protein